VLKKNHVLTLIHTTKELFVLYLQNFSSGNSFIYSMKKLFSISFAFLILLSGMHLSIATHTCGGEIAAVKWSFTGEKATCGMEESTENCPAEKSVSTNCCHNEVSVYAVDNNYSASSIQFQKVSQKLLQVFAVPVTFSLNSFSETIFINTIGNPPENLLATAVSISDICVFRI
jgi:hypothetical protein